MSEDNVNKLFTQFKNKYVSVDLRGDYQTEGKVIAIDNYLNLVLENENGIEIPIATGQYVDESATGLRGVFYSAHGVPGRELEPLC
jgi:small nuclear ribonucleoprotein (snRNP)-like protein